jgi:hypothetical protein
LVLDFPSHRRTPRQERARQGREKVEPAMAGLALKDEKKYRFNIRFIV